MIRRVAITLLVAAVAATYPLHLGAAQAAQSAPSAAGRWEGRLDVPNQPLEVIVDLVQKGAGWEGVITIPAQNLKAFPLSGVTVTGDAVSFAMTAPGSPQFTGKIDATGKTLAGDFTQGGGTLKFSLARTGDAKIEPPPPSTPIGKAHEGTWEGALEGGGRTLRLVLKLSTGADGLGQGTLVSVDQGNTEIKIQTVSLVIDRLRLLLPAIAGSWEGQLNGDQLEGSWTQGPGSRPLTFKRAVAK
jgi:hypothetical protein